MKPLAIGNQYKTEGGHRAMVVDHYKEDDTWLVWHEEGDKTCYHNPDGACEYHIEKYNLIEDWVEPTTRDFWIEVYQTKGGEINSCVFTSEGLFQETLEITKLHGYKTLAVKKVTITDGEGMK